MEIRQEFIVNAPCDRVWNILGHQYSQVSIWASDVYASRQHDLGTVLHDAPCAGRVCETSMGKFKETITHYDEQRKQVSYTAKGDKMPFFVKRLVNNWTVVPLENHRSKVEMRLDVSLLPVFDVVMGPMLQKQMKTVTQAVAEDLTYFAEKGNPHPRKFEARQHNRLKTA
ncbi:MAG: SRPBCC family protein [Cyanobacteria bacterium J06626_14]